MACQQVLKLSLADKRWALASRRELLRSDNDLQNASDHLLQLNIMERMKREPALVDHGWADQQQLLPCLVAA